MQTVSKLLVTTIFASAVGACGGGGTSSTGSVGQNSAGINQASTGFALPSSSVNAPAAGTTFSTDARVIQVNGNNVGLKDNSYVIESTSNPNVYNVTVNGKQFAANTTVSGSSLFGVPLNQTLLSGASGGDFILFGTVDTQQFTKLAVIANGTGTLGTINSPSASGEVGFVAYGYNTDPATIAGRTATANYAGTAAMVIAVDDGTAAGGTGTINLSADFNNSTTSGNLNLSYFDPGIGANRSVAMGINQGNITGNSFTNSLNVNPADFGATSVTKASLSGAFYGDTGQEIGGSFSASGADATTGDTGVLQGTFFGTEN